MVNKAMFIGGYNTEGATTTATLLGHQLVAITSPGTRIRPRLTSRAAILHPISCKF